MEAVAGLVGGAVLGAVAGELLKEVQQAKDAISSFQPMFQRIESTLASIIPRVDAIIGLNHNLDIQQHKIEELTLIVKDGKSLVLKCRQISNINYIKKIQYGKELTNLDDRLKDCFLTLLPLDHFRNDLEMLNLVRDLHAKLVAELSTNVADDTEFLSTTAYHRKGMKNLYMIEGYPHDLDLVDLSKGDLEVLSKGKYAITYRYNTTFGKVVVKSLTDDVKMTNKEFQQRIEEIGKIGQHPNIALPFGHYFSELDKFLLYDYAPAGSLSSFLKEPTRVGSRPDWNNRLKIILGIARGINHIHSESGVVHGNIKSSNVILINRAGELNGCISDFRLAPIVNFPEPAATIRKLQKAVPQLPAPELHTTKEATQQSDVYDFGVMLLEIVSSYGKHVFLHPNVLVEEAKILGLVQRCTRKDCGSRPNMDEVVKMIQKVISNEDVSNLGCWLPPLIGFSSEFLLIGDFGSLTYNNFLS